MSFLGEVSISRAVDGAKVDAEVVTLTPALAKTKIDLQWWKHPDLDLTKPETDQRWNWESIALSYGQNIFRSCAAVLSPEDYLEGAIAYQLDAKSKLEAGEGCLYLGWLATAPRNRKWVCSTPVYKEVGLVLLQRAIQESNLNGLGGRINLDSVPTLKTVEFYEANGFVRTGAKPFEPALINFELPLIAAQKLLQEAKDA